MQGKELYEYAIIRLVPKVERQEFLNVGVILFSSRKKYLKMKYYINEDKIKSFSQNIDIELVKEYLNAWELVCRGGSGGGKIGELDRHLRFRWLTSSRSTIIQSSAVHPGFCDDIESRLEKLFIKFVI